MINGSRLEFVLSVQIGHSPVACDGVKAEYLFHESRRWRFDFAWPEKKIAVEVEGGVFIRGRHTRGSGFEKDAEKYNAAALRGWRVLRYTRKGVMNGAAIREIERALAGGISQPVQRSL
jgi:very-short-patch-repair endonuclease